MAAPRNSARVVAEVLVQHGVDLGVESARGVESRWLDRAGSRLILEGRIDALQQVRSLVVCRHRVLTTGTLAGIAGNVIGGGRNFCASCCARTGTSGNGTSML